jgi:hypothetical protein
MFASPLFRLSIPPKIVVSGGGPADTVNDSFLQAYWRLDEASGTRADTKGSNNLTDSGATGNTSGVISNAANFAGSTALYCLDNASLSIGSTDWSFSVWFKLTNISGVNGIAGKGQGLEWALWVNGTTLNYTHANGGGANGNIAWGTAVAANTLYHVIIDYDNTNLIKTMTVNGGTPVTGVFNIQASDSTSAFVIGSGTSTASSWNVIGFIDEVLFTKRLLTSTEKSALYNSGAGARPAGL